MISIVVRSFNDEYCIRETLSRLLNQKCDEPVEVLSFDSGSSDRTPEIIREFPQVRMIPPADEKYNPARTLNRAITFCSGDIIVFNNSDAIPQSADYLSHLLRPFSTPEVQAVFGRQIPRPDALPLVRKDYQDAFGDGATARKWRHFFSIASAAVRKEVFARVAFDPEFQYSEDTEWSWRLKNRFDGKIAYAADAVVEHSHNYTDDELKKRFYNEGVHNAKIWRNAPSFGRFLLSVLMAFCRDAKFLYREKQLSYCFSGIRYRWIQRYNIYLGERNGARMK